jgi:tetratricopeptide (TPR) repeat protein
VYAAHDPSLDRKVALKLMLAEVSAQDDFAQERLLREAQAIARLSHPNVVVVHDVGTFAGRIFVAMEFVEGKTLAAWLEEKERPWREVVEAFLQAARGLSAAHRAGIVHRDFKPQNVMVASDGAVRVMDFGLARRIGDQSVERVSLATTSSGDDPAITRPGEQLGTPLYMAPEQFAGGTIDARADQFAFCVSLSWALRGAHPFGGGASSATASAKPARPVPPWLLRVLTRGLGVDPSSRWPSMDALVAALAGDPQRRRRRIAAVALAVTGCIVLGVAATRTIDARRALCEGGAARAATVWEDAASGQRAGSRRARLRSAILASGASDVAQTWEKVAALLDRRMAAWVGAYREACEATNVRHEQSAELMDLRMACLSESLDSTKALADLLAGGDPSAIARSAEAVSSLEDLGRCSDVRRLRLGPEPPRDPKVRVRVEELRRRLRASDALFEVGAFGRSAEAARAILAEAEPLHYCPLEAEVMVVEGDAELAFGGMEHGLATLEHAIERAESCGHDRVVARAATELVWGYGFHQPNLAERYAALARGAIARLGGDSRLEGWLANNTGSLLYQEGRLEEARQSAERAVEIKRRALGPDNVDTAISMAALANVLCELNRAEEGLPIIEEAIAILKRWGTADSSLFPTTLAVRAGLVAKLGRYAEAEQALREVLARKNAVVNDVGAARMHSGLGEILVHSGRPADAIPELERAARLQVIDSPFELAHTRFWLARARDELRPGDAVARDLAAQAAAVFATSPYFQSQRDEVTDWLAARQPARSAARSSAARKLSGRAVPVPAMSNAVP